MKFCPAAGSKFQELEVDPEHSDKESIFTHSQDQTSSSSLDEESPRLTQHSSFQSSKRTPLSAPARTHRLPSPSGNPNFHFHNCHSMFIHSGKATSMWKYTWDLKGCLHTAIIPVVGGIVYFLWIYFWGIRRDEVHWWQPQAQLLLLAQLRYKVWLGLIAIVVVYFP